MSERKLATVRVIDSIIPIEGADKIEKAIIGGWSVVIQKGDYSENQKVIFLRYFNAIKEGKVQDQGV